MGQILSVLRAEKHLPPFKLSTANHHPMHCQFCHFQTGSILHSLALTSKFSNFFCTGLVIKLLMIHEPLFCLLWGCGPYLLFVSFAIWTLRVYVMKKCWRVLAPSSRANNAWTACLNNLACDRINLNPQIPGLFYWSWLQDSCCDHKVFSGFLDFTDIKQSFALVKALSLLFTLSKKYHSVYGGKATSQRDSW